MGGGGLSLFCEVGNVWSVMSVRKEIEWQKCLLRKV